MISRSRRGTFAVPFITLTTLAALAWPQGAAAQSASEILSAALPSQILELFNSSGDSSAKLTVDAATGDPRIRGQIGAKPYSVYFYGCNNGKDCTDIQFNAAWTGVQVTPARLNEWHQMSLYGRAYVVNNSQDRKTAGAVVLQMPINLDHGVSRKSLTSAFNDWVMAVQDFERNVISQAPPVPAR